MFFPPIDDSHCDRIHSSLTAVRCFDNGYVGKQSVAWKEYCAEYWLKEKRQESMDRYTGRSDITEILLKKALKTTNSINQSIKRNTTSHSLNHFCGCVSSPNHSTFADLQQQVLDTNNNLEVVKQ